MSSLKECIDHLNSIVDECEGAAFITRCRSLQEEASASLDALLSQAASLKNQAVDQANEDAANTFLGFECVGRSLKSETRMWLLLKDEKPDEAWDELINAQTAAVAAYLLNPARIRTVLVG